MSIRFFNNVNEEGTNGSGHVIKNDTSTFQQRENLKFKGNNFIVTDNETEDTTEVEVNPDTFKTVQGDQGLIGDKPVNSTNRQNGSIPMYDDAKNEYVMAQSIISAGGGHITRTGTFTIADGETVDIAHQEITDNLAIIDVKEVVAGQTVTYEKIASSSTEYLWGQEDSENGTDFLGENSRINPVVELNNNKVYDDYTKLCLHMNGVDGEAYFTDELGNNVEVYGNTKTVSDLEMLGGSALYVARDGYLKIPYNSNLDYNDESITIEFNFKIPNPPIIRDDVLAASWNTSGGFQINVQRTGTMIVYFQYAGYLSFFTSNLTGLFDNKMHHIAMCFNKTLQKYMLFIDGIKVEEQSVSSITPINDAIYIGTYNGDYSYSTTAYVNEFIYSIGIAKYTEDFTPPTQKYNFGIDYITTQPYYITSPNFSTLTISSVNNTYLYGDIPPNTSIKYLVSFDGGITYKHYNGTSWVIDTMDNLQANGMTPTQVETNKYELTELQNYAVDHATDTGIVIAFDLATTDSTVTPSISKLEFVADEIPTLITLRQGDLTDMYAQVFLKESYVPGGTYSATQVTNISGESKDIMLVIADGQT